LYHAAVAAAGNTAFNIAGYFGENVGNGTGSNIPPHVYAQIQNDEEYETYKDDDGYWLDRIKCNFGNDGKVRVYYIDGTYFGKSSPPRLIGTLINPNTGLVQLKNGHLTTLKRVEDQCDAAFTNFDEFMENEGYAKLVIRINLENAPGHKGAFSGPNWEDYKFDFNEVKQKIEDIFKDQPFEVIVCKTEQSKGELKRIGSVGWTYDSTWLWSPYSRKKPHLNAMFLSAQQQMYLVVY